MGYLSRDLAPGISCGWGADIVMESITLIMALRWAIEWNDLVLTRSPRNGTGKRFVFQSSFWAPQWQTSRPL